MLGILISLIISLADELEAVRLHNKNEAITMKKMRLLATITMIAGLLMLVASFFDFLALTDISHDYVSQQVLDKLKISLPRELPEWTATRREWQVVSISYISRIGFLLLNTITLGLCVKKFMDQDSMYPETE